MPKKMLSLGPDGKLVLRLSDGRSETPSKGEGTAYVALDCSGSMFGEKLRDAKRGSLQFAKDAITKGYRVGLISFAADASHLSEPRDNPADLEPLMELISAAGGTNMLAAVHLARGGLNCPGQRTLVIVTDGIPEEPDEVLRAAELATRGGIRILAIGTDDADWDFLRRLASEPGLALKVTAAQLEQSIASAAKLLPDGSGKR